MYTVSNPHHRRMTRRARYVSVIARRPSPARLANAMSLNEFVTALYDFSISVVQSSEANHVGGPAIDDHGADEPHTAVRARLKSFKEIRRGIGDRAQVHVTLCLRGVVDRYALNRASRAGIRCIASSFFFWPALVSYPAFQIW